MRIRLLQTRPYLGSAGSEKSIDAPSAKVLIAMGIAEEVTDEKPVRKKRTYRRRDMVAETPAESDVEVLPEPEPEVEAEEAEETPEVEEEPESD